MVVRSYGDRSCPRPRLDTGLDPGISATGGGGGPDRIDYLVISEIEFRAEGRDRDVGISWLVGTRGLLIEDVVIRGYYLGISLIDFDNRGIEGVRIRRSQILDSFGFSEGHSQGIYVEGVEGLTVEESLFDHNGWNPAVSGAQATIFNHNAYVQNGNRNIIFRRNIFARGSSHGLQLRSGGIADDNLFLANSIGLLVGGGNDPEPQGISGSATGNVVTEGKDITPKLPRAWGIEVSNVSPSHPVAVRNNLVIHVASASPNRFAFDIELAAIVSGNFAFDWSPDEDSPGHVFADPTRTIASHQKGRGGLVGMDGFLEEARGQERDRWNVDLTAAAVIGYLRAGFAPRP